MKRNYKLLLAISFWLLAYSQWLTANSKIDSLEKLLAKSKEDTSKVNLLNFLSEEYRSVNPSNGMEYAEQALKLAERKKFQMGIANALANLGNLQMSLGNYEKALEYFNKGKQLSKTIGEKILLSNILNSMGITYARQSNYSKAVECFLKALAMREELRDKKGNFCNTE